MPPDIRQPPKFRYGDRVTHVWPRSTVEVTGKIVASTPHDITIEDDSGVEFRGIPHGSFRKADEAPDE